jgi:DNA-binding PadR family transcriptional regulator
MFGPHRHRRPPFGPILGLAAVAAIPKMHHRWGGPWGGGFGKGPFGPPGRRFGRGDLKYVILDLLSEGPRHGYDIIRVLEEQFHGFYTPSPGSVYPTLQLLEDQGYVTSEQRDGKRVYSITDEGRAFLSQQKDAVEGARSRMHGHWNRGGPEMQELMNEVRQLGQLLMREGMSGGFSDPATVRRLREVVARTRSEVEAIFAGNPTEIV